MCSSLASPSGWACSLESSFPAWRSTGSPYSSGGPRSRTSSAGRCSEPAAALWDPQLVPALAGWGRGNGRTPWQHQPGACRAPERPWAESAAGCWATGCPPADRTHAWSAAGSPVGESRCCPPSRKAPGQRWPSWGRPSEAPCKRIQTFPLEMFSAKQTKRKTGRWLADEKGNVLGVVLEGGAHDLNCKMQHLYCFSALTNVLKRSADSLCASRATFIICCRWIPQSGLLLAAAAVVVAAAVLGSTAMSSSRRESNAEEGGKDLSLVLGWPTSLHGQGGTCCTKATSVKAAGRKNRLLSFFKRKTLRVIVRGSGREK